MTRSIIAVIALLVLTASATAQTRQELMGNPAHMRAIGAHPSPALLEYQALMMPVQRAQRGAYYANLCQLRSEAYFNTFLNATIEISRIEATKRGLSNDEILVADRNATEIMEREDGKAGFDDFERRCRDVAGRLDVLDAMERSLSGNYH